jgi:transposase
MASRLPQLLNFNQTDINWDYVYEYANKNLIKELANLYQEGMSAKELAKMLNMPHGTVCRYLNIAHTLGWCNYDKHLIRCKGQQKRRDAERTGTI